MLSIRLLGNSGEGSRSRTLVCSFCGNFSNGPYTIQEKDPHHACCNPRMSFGFPGSLAYSRTRFRVLLMEQAAYQAWAWGCVIRQVVLGFFGRFHLKFSLKSRQDNNTLHAPLARILNLAAFSLNPQLLNSSLILIPKALLNLKP